MGACEFSEIAFGKTAQEAFDTVVRQAEWEHGHGGYTGTIAEKGADGFVEMNKTANGKPYTQADVDRMLKIAHDKMFGFVKYNGGCGNDAKEDKAAKRRYNSLSPAERDWVNKAEKLIGDKWGACLCFTMQGLAAAGWRAKNNCKGKRGNVYVFIGTASS